MIDVPSGLGGVEIKSVKLAERTYPVGRTGFFKCSDPVFEKLYNIGLLTTKLCMLDTYVDCPSRERVLWMDSYLEAICSSYGMGITELWRKVIYMYGQNICKTGALKDAIKGFVPCDYDPILSTYIMYYVCSVAEYVRHSGDTKTAKALFDTVMKQFDVLSRFHTKEGLIDDKWPSWNFIDWSAMDYGGVSGAINALYIVMHRKAIKIAEYVGHKTVRASGRNDVSKKLNRRLEKLKETYRKTFWNEKEGIFIDALYDGKPSPVRSQVTNLLAIWAGVVDRREATAIIKKILDRKKVLPRTPGNYLLTKGFLPQKKGIVPVGTPALGFLMGHVLFELGLDNEALSYIKQNWTKIARNGTFEEHFKYDHSITSFCHAWGAGPVALLPGYVLGVKPVGPGWKKIEINPHTGNLKWARGVIPTAMGEISVGWEKKKEGTVITVKVPKSVEVEEKKEFIEKKCVFNIYRY